MLLNLVSKFIENYCTCVSPITYGPKFLPFIIWTQVLGWESLCAKGARYGVRVQFRCFSAVPIIENHKKIWPAIIVMFLVQITQDTEQ